MVGDNESHFELLTREGSVSVWFRPSLPDSAYAELMEAVERVDSQEALRTALLKLADHWGLAVKFDD